MPVCFWSWGASRAPPTYSSGFLCLAGGRWQPPEWSGLMGFHPLLLLFLSLSFLTLTSRDRLACRGSLAARVALGRWPCSRSGKALPNSTSAAAKETAQRSGKGSPSGPRRDGAATSRVLRVGPAGLIFIGLFAFQNKLLVGGCEPCRRECSESSWNARGPAASLLPAPLCRGPPGWGDQLGVLCPAQAGWSWRGGGSGWASFRKTERGCQAVRDARCAAFGAGTVPQKSGSTRGSERPRAA